MNKNKKITKYTIYDYLYPKYKITRPIRLIELFAGYGSQALALKYLNVDFKHWKICEWAINSIQAYNDLHFQDYFDYSGDIEDDKLLDVLIKLGVSINYNDPATREQLKRRNFRKIYNNIIATKNLVDIKKVKGKDLEIVDKDKYDYIMTYSFPCQDLSLAGKRKGMSNTSTRSGLLWEVERILTECKELGNLPQILLMENVPQVHNQDNIEDFNKWQLSLEKLGYKNYVKDLMATDYEIPQTRNRCFMISVLGDYSYSFPQKQKLKLRLKDMLDDDVEEKYFLSYEVIDFLYENSKGKKKVNEVVIVGNYSPSKHNASRIVDNKGCSPTVMENHGTVTATQTSDLRIRKLTPRECFRLMGVKGKDFEKISKNQSNSSLYHLAGDSIVVNVLMAIFKEFFEEVENARK